MIVKEITKTEKYIKRLTIRREGWDDTKFYYDEPYISEEDSQRKYEKVLAEYNEEIRAYEEEGASYPYWGKPIMTIEWDIFKFGKVKILKEEIKVVDKI